MSLCAEVAADEEPPSFPPVFVPSLSLLAFDASSRKENPGGNSVPEDESGGVAAPDAEPASAQQDTL